MSSNRAYVDTSVLTDALLKSNEQGVVARDALKKYSESILPVYAIKEFKAGPLEYLVWLHNKLVSTKSLTNTIAAINILVSRQPNRVKMSLQVLGDFLRAGTVSTMSDEEHAALFRGSIVQLILSAWNKRRKVTFSVTDELSCYAEISPQIELRTGYFSNQKRFCKFYSDKEECCLAKNLKSRKEDLERLIEAIKDRTGREHTRRRAVLHKLKNTPKRLMDSKDCTSLGDAYFALNAPQDVPILTTNLKDHVPLATALGKTAVGP